MAQAACAQRPPQAVADRRERRPPAELGARLAFDSGSRSAIIRAMYGATRRGSHDGTAIGRGAPAASATARTISLKLTGSSSTMS